MLRVFCLAEGFSLFIVVLHKLYIYVTVHRKIYFYRGADKSLALPTSQCILFDGENISFDASLVIYT
jgi:hypothetical protein